MRRVAVGRRGRPSTLRASGNQFGKFGACAFHDTGSGYGRSAPRSAPSVKGIVHSHLLGQGGVAPETAARHQARTASSSGGRCAGQAPRESSKAAGVGLGDGRCQDRHILFQARPRSARGTRAPPPRSGRTLLSRTRPAPRAWRRDAASATASLESARIHPAGRGARAQILRYPDQTVPRAAATDRCRNGLIRLRETPGAAPPPAGTRPPPAGRPRWPEAGPSRRAPVLSHPLDAYSPQTGSKRGNSTSFSSAIWAARSSSSAATPP